MRLGGRDDRVTGILKVAARVATGRGVAAQDSSTAEAPPKMDPSRAPRIARRTPSGPLHRARGLLGPVVTWPTPQGMLEGESASAILQCFRDSHAMPTSLGVCASMGATLAGGHCGANAADEARATATRKPPLSRRSLVHRTVALRTALACPPSRYPTITTRSPDAATNPLEMLSCPPNDQTSPPCEVQTRVSD